MIYNFEVIPNQQTPKVEMIVDVPAFIKDNREMLMAYYDYVLTKNNAVGLAANQNSLNGERFMVRMFGLRDINVRDSNAWTLIFNPTLKPIGMVDTKIEGCLTWKDKLIIAERSRAVEVSYYDMNGNYHQGEVYKGFEGQIWQHEINHLDGIEENVQDRSYPIPKLMDVQRNEKCPCGKMDISLDVFALHELYDNGKTLQELEDLTGIGRKTISRLFKKHGLHVRNKSECAIGELNSQFNGEPRYTKDGYVEIWNGTERILEHRYVMEQHLNRKLTNIDVIHHINGIKDDNDINNLELTTSSEHRKKHKLPVGEWSKHYEFCVKCGTTERKHAGNGYCTKCNMVIRGDNKRGYESEYDEEGKRIFTENHIEKLRKAAVLREAAKKYKQCCLLLL